MLEKLSGQYLDNLLISMHKERCGLSQQEAELEFLKVCNGREYNYVCIIIVKLFSLPPGSTETA